ncbi:hypothetical protein [Janibacter massiliensis]|uniref:hypothetical protein n=1 Tax=Janibacter massiliensis TaxID=2058291 RepID=UPI00131A4BBE|nr:hypothetical protein [Janibacter massiliensis]
MSDFLREMGRSLVQMLRGVRDPEVWAETVLLLVVMAGYFTAFYAIAGLIEWVIR